MTISPKEFTELMTKIYETGCCPGENMIAAELLMCDVLESLGYEEGIKVFKLNEGYDE